MINQWGINPIIFHNPNSSFGVKINGVYAFKLWSLIPNIADGFIAALIKYKFFPWYSNIHIWLS